jgi:hypothetical protein
MKFPTVSLGVLLSAFSQQASSFGLTNNGVPKTTTFGTQIRFVAPKTTQMLHSTPSDDNDKEKKSDLEESLEALGEAAGDAAESVESAALEWASKQARELGSDDDGIAEDAKVNTEGADEAVAEDSVNKKKKYVVVGGGWGGWGAAKALCQSNVDAEVILIDALPDPTGKTPYLSKTGKPVEAGTRGFWMVSATCLLLVALRLSACFCLSGLF